MNLFLRAFVSSIALASLPATPAFTQWGDLLRGPSEATLPVVVLPSPNSALLTRTISENIDLYTGKLSIDIPLYTLKSRNIEVPISLQTTANAHRVNEIGGWTGIGWQLNAGGVITRVMKNLPDEFNGTISPCFNFPGVGYLNLNTAQYGFVNLKKFGPVLPPISTAYTINEMKDIINKGSWNTQRDWPNIGYDLQPDEFYFNFGKYSGKFVFDETGNIHFSIANNLTVNKTIVNGKITSFTIKTDDGYTYEFGNYTLNAVEETKLTVSSKSLLYTYAATTCTDTIDLTIPTGIIENVPKYLYNGTACVMSFMSPEFFSVNHAASNNDLMTFNHPNNQYNAQYCTYPSSWYLTKITSPTGDVVTLNYIDNGTLTYVTDRSFTQSGPAGQALNKPTSCVTNNYWAYFYSLAKPESKQLISGFKHYPSFGDNTASTSTIELKSKRLKEIITSQGYKVSFVAATPREDFAGDKRLDEINIENNGTLIKKYTFNYEIVQNNEAVETRNFSFVKPYYFYNMGPNSSPGPFAYLSFTSGSFTLTGEIDVSMRKRMFLTSITEKGTGQENIPPFRFDYFDKTGLPFRTSFNQDVYGFAKDNTTPPVTAKLKAGVLKSITYPTGGYKEFDFELSGNATTWNGLRIKSVKEYPSATDPAIVKNYTYGQFVATDQAVASYGMPDLVLNYTYNGQNVMMPLTTKNFYSSNRVNAEKLTKGAGGGYSFAEVSQPGNGTYRIEFTTGAQYTDEEPHTTLVSGFSGGFTRDVTAAYGVYYPFTQPISNDWQRGLPVAEYIRDNNNKLLKSTHYNYDFTSNAHAPGTSMGMQVSKYRIDYGADFNWMLYGRYSVSPRWQLLTSKTDRIYAADGVAYKENKVENTYSKVDYNFKTLLFLRESKINATSKKEQIVEKYKYPLDYNATTDAFGVGITQLRNKNIFNTIIEKYRYLQNQDGSNKRYVSGALNKYHGDKPLLYQSYALQPSASLNSFTESNISGSSFVHDAKYNALLTFSNYNAYGNILEQTENPDVTEAYVWDYNNTYAVAKVANATYSDIAYTSFEADGTGSWTLGTTSRSTAVFVTGKKCYELANAPITRSGLTPGKSYIFSFWARPGADVGATGTQATLQGPLINGWIYWEKTITGVSTINISGSGLIDEIRLYPKDALMTTYTFDPLVGMTSQCDENNRVTYYEYDGLQRLKIVRDAARNIIKTLEYNYQEGGSSPLWTTTAERRCKACELNPVYHTNIQQVKQIDVNPNSPGYNTFQWIDVGDNGACIIQADWQNTGSPTCLTNGSGQQTGVQRYLQKDMNPCSNTYNTTRLADAINYAACPSTLPDWQSTNDYRCQPCTANPVYTSNNQQRKFVDMNPSSSTYQQIDWRATGNTCTPTSGWVFTNTPERCQVDQSGLNTGYLEREQRDMNPCSPTYNNLQWVTTIPSPNCEPVYAFISYENISYGYYTTADIVVRFYHDPYQNTPANVSGVPITLVTAQFRDCGSASFTTQDFICYGSAMTLLSGAYLGYEEYYGCYTYFDYYRQ